MHHADNFDTGVDAGSHDTALKRAEPGRPGRGRVRSLAPRGLAGLLAALVALPLQAQAQTASTDATLSGLEILGAPDGETIALIPVFDAATGAYTAMVANRIDAVTLTATKNDNTATVAITSDDNTNTPDEAVLSLTVLADTLTVTVTAADTTTTQTYTITVARAAAHPAPTDCPADTAWCATLGVGFADVSPNNFIKTEIWGYQRDASYGDLSPVTFSHGGTSYTVAFLYRLNSTAGGITVGDQLNLDVDRLDLPDGTVLQLGSRTFTVDTVSDTGTPGLEEWDLQANPLDWTAEQHVTASLKFPPPPAPVTGVTGVTGVTVAAGDMELVVEWTAVDTATGYTVQWKTDGGATRVYVDHRRWSSSQDTRWENGRRAARVQYAECDDRHGPPSFLRRRSMKHRWLGPWRASFDSCTNASEPEADSRAAAAALAVACEAAPHEHVRPGAHGDPGGDAALSLKGSDAEANRDAVIGIIRLRQVRQRHRHRHTRLGYCRALVEPVEPAVDAAQPASDGVEAHGMNPQPLRVLHDVLLVRGGQSSVVANLETVLTDGRRVPADAGAVRVDVGAILPDAGAVRVDVGAILPDAGAVRVDGGAVLPDGGAVHPDVSRVPLDAVAVRVDGGAVLPDGGAVHPDVSRVPLCAAVNVDDRLPLRPGREPDRADLRAVHPDVIRVPLDAVAVRVDVSRVPLCAAVNVDDRLPLHPGHEPDRADLRAGRVDVIRVLPCAAVNVDDRLPLRPGHEPDRAGRVPERADVSRVLLDAGGVRFDFHFDVREGTQFLGTKSLLCLRGACPKAGDDDDGDGVELTHGAISFVAPTGSGHWGIARDNCSYRELS